MALLEQNTSFINQVDGVVPFIDMMDRLYWIVNSTATTYMQQIALGTFDAQQLNFLATWVSEVVQVYEISETDDGGEFASYFYPLLDMYKSPATGVPNPSMPFLPAINFTAAQCFAGYNPTNNNGQGTIGRNAGPSGVFW